MTDLLLKYEERLKSKREISQLAYQKFTSELFVLESEVDKKHRDRYQVMKGFAQDFLTHQSEGMEMMAEVTRGVYEILEKMAEEQISKDPLAYIRNEQQSFFKHRNSIPGVMLKCDENEAELDEFKDALDDGTPFNYLFTQEMIGEFEEVYQGAHENIVN